MKKKRKEKYKIDFFIHKKTKIQKNPLKTQKNN